MCSVLWMVREAMPFTQVLAGELALTLRARGKRAQMREVTDLPLRLPRTPGTAHPGPLCRLLCHLGHLLGFLL